MEKPDNSFWSRAKSWLNTEKSSWIDKGGSHSYIHTIPLGKTEEVGTAEEVMDRVKKNPNGYFPMTRVDGSLQNEGDVGYLKPFSVGNGNPVEVTYTDSTTLELKAKPGHTFQGTAQHATYQYGGYTYYQVAGMGPEGKEPVWKQIVNNNFPWGTAVALKGTGEKEEKK
jgi:hypothetical protein